jgi:hypothetical protein
VTDMVVGMETFDIDALPVDWEALTSAGRAMTEAADRQRWQLGDLGNKVQRVYGSESLKTFAGEINIPNHKTLWDYSRVAARFEKSVRNEFPALSFTHFRTAMRAKDDAELFLVQAQDNGWPVAELARKIAAAIGKPVPPVKLWEGRAKVYGWTETMGAVCMVLYCERGALPDGQIVTIKVYAEAV